MLPKHILKAAEKNKTSIGDNPCLPPEEETNFIVKLLSEYYDEISSRIKTDNIDELKNELNELILKCKKIENQHKNDLENICVECVNELFHIPEDTIDLNVSLVNKIDTSAERLYPESNIDYEFETISDMDKLTQEIYKRRFLNSLISGAALYYASNFKPYFQKVFEIDTELPSLYKKIMTINNILLFLEKDTLDISENNDGGKVDVFISNNENLVQIKSEAILFPILLNETIKGLLELSISHGLPEEREKANYIISKADFKFAELWDLRLGIPLWKRFLKLAEKSNIDIEAVGINYFTMDLASISPDNFNIDIKEMLANTKRGSEVLQNVCTSIINSKEEDEFNDYMITQQNNQIQITDDDYFEADELITEFFNGEYK